MKPQGEAVNSTSRNGEKKTRRAKKKKPRSPVKASEALRFILDECDWEESMQHACGDNRIGVVARRALEEK